MGQNCALQLYAFAVYINIVEFFLVECDQRPNTHKHREIGSGVVVALIPGCYVIIFHSLLYCNINVHNLLFLSVLFLINNTHRETQRRDGDPRSFVWAP